MVKAFNDLMTCRPVHVGMSGAIMGEIPWTAINEMAYRLGIHDPDDFEDFMGLIRALEAENRKAENEEKERATPNRQGQR